jgi:hypothetical protein
MSEEEESYGFKLDYQGTITMQINRIVASVDESTFMIHVDHLRLLTEPYFDQKTEEEIRQLSEEYKKRSAATLDLVERRRLLYERSVALFRLLLKRLDQLGWLAKRREVRTKL